MLLDPLLMIPHASWYFLTLLETSWYFLVILGLLFCRNVLVLAAALHCWTWTALFTLLLCSLLPNRQFQLFIFSRPGRSQGLLYKHLRHWFIQWVSLFLPQLYGAAMPKRLHRMPLYFIPVSVSQRLARTLLKRLLSKNLNFNTQPTHASRHPGA